MTGTNVLGETISEEEAALYDRQLRLWGVEAQNKLKHASILLIGMTPLAAELAKNLVLAGVSCISVADDTISTEDDSNLNFLIPATAVGGVRANAAMSHLQALNPMVRVTALNSMSDEKLTTLFSEYDVIILTTALSRMDFNRWRYFAKAVDHYKCDSKKPHVVFASTVACYGTAFVDFGEHTFVASQDASKQLPSNKPHPTNQSSLESISSKKTLAYPGLDEALTCIHSPKFTPKGFFILETLRECDTDCLPYTAIGLRSKWIQVAQKLCVDEALLTEEDFLCCCGRPVPSANAVLGGLVAQEIVRGITGNGAPPGNWYFMNGIQCSVTVEWLPSTNQME